MVNGTDKVKRISFYFNEEDQRASFVFDFLMEKGRKKTKYIIDLILSNLPNEDYESELEEKNNTIKIVDPNKPHKEKRKLSGQEIYSDNNQNKIMVDGSSAYENDLFVSPTTVPTQLATYTPPLSNSDSLPTQNNESNEAENKGKKDDPFLAKIMSGLSAFDEF